MAQSNQGELSREKIDKLVFKISKDLCRRNITLDKKPPNQSDTIERIEYDTYLWLRKQSKEFPSIFSRSNGARELGAGIAYFIHKALAFVTTDQLIKNRAALIDNIYWKDRLGFGLEPAAEWGLTKQDFKIGVRISIILEASRIIVANQMNVADDFLQKELMTSLLEDSLQKLSIKSTPPPKATTEEYVQYYEGIRLMIYRILLVLPEEKQVINQAIKKFADRKYWKQKYTGDLIPIPREWGLDEKDIIDAIRASIEAYAETFILKQADHFVSHAPESFFKSKTNALESSSSSSSENLDPNSSEGSKKPDEYWF